MTSFNNKNELPDNFCILPFIHLATRPNVTFRLCCKTIGYSIPRNGYEDEDNYGGISNENLFNANDDDIGNVWNSNYMKDIRKKFLRNEKPDPCFACWDDENNNRQSMRLKKQEHWNISNYLDRIKESYYNNGELSYKPTYLDLKLGNLCNLKCRMCGPLSSNQFSKEINNMMNDDDKLQKVPEHLLKQLKSTNYENWYEKNNFWDYVYECLPYIEKIYATGGEQMVNKNLISFLKFCVENDYAKNIELQITTNLTVMNKEILNLCGQFKEVVFSCSIDGYNRLNEYIRYPSSWEVIEQNLNLLKNKYTNIIVSISITLQVYNVLNLNSLLKFLEHMFSEINYDLTFINCTEPKIFDVKYLPDEIKNESLKRLYEFNIQKTSNVKKTLENNLGNFDKDIFCDFIKETKKFDNIRNQNHKNILDPLLLKYIEKFEE